MPASKQEKITWLKYVRKGLERATNTAKNGQIKDIYSQEMARLDEWANEIQAQK